MECLNLLALLFFSAFQFMCDQTRINTSPHTTTAPRKLTCHVQHVPALTRVSLFTYQRAAGEDMGAILVSSGMYFNQC